MTTLDEARAAVKQTLDSGGIGICPCCGQTIKMYARQIYGTMVKQLAQLVAYGQGLHPRNLVGGNNLSGGGDHAKMRFWGLVDQDPEDGVWFATVKGADFLKGRISVPKYAYIFNNTLDSFSDEEVRVEDCCSKSFDLPELLKARANIT